MTFNEYIDDQRSRLMQMANNHMDWDLSDNDRAACRSGADAIDIIRGFMHTPDFRPGEPSEAHQAIYAQMRELLCRGESA